jgi:predicted SAM-dependent methyltransferase
MKLHIGGEEVKYGWKILNAQSKPGVDFIGDITDLSSFQENSFEEIYASHVLEHVRQSEVIDSLKGINRILFKGGKLYISVPDLDILAHSFLSPWLSPAEKYHVMRLIFGGQVDEFDYHYFGWNQQFLFDALSESGFSKFDRVEGFGIFKDTSEFKPFGFPISLNVVAIK